MSFPSQRGVGNSSRAAGPDSMRVGDPVEETLVGMRMMGMNSAMLVRHSRRQNQSVDARIFRRTEITEGTQ